MRIRGSAIVASVAIGAFLTLRALAFADPPDPSWIGGFWDDDDYDDVVILVASTVGVIDSHPHIHPGPVLATAALGACPRESLDLTRAAKSNRPRDPPTT